MSDYTFHSTMPPDVFVVYGHEQQEIIRITREGDLYHKGRKVETDQEFTKAVTEFLQIWNKNHAR